MKFVNLEQLLRSFPEERVVLRSYADRAEAYKNECGCSTGAVFLVVSLGLLLVYGAFLHDFSKSNPLIALLEGGAFVFAASVVGKLTGIGIARIRLALLYRHLCVKYGVEES